MSKFTNGAASIMSRDNTTFIARLPRHPVSDTNGIALCVRCPNNDTIPVVMLDLSRRGMQFHANVHIDSATPVVVLMTLTRDKPLEWEFAGVIRRVVPQELGEWTYGCEFDEMVSWEQLGELLLRGVLSPE